MVSPLSKSASKSFLWTFPECPVRIHVNLPFIDRFRKDVLDVAPADREIGGLLIGRLLPGNGNVEVLDYFQLPPGSESAKNFSICSDFLAQSLKSASAAPGRVVGFYRTHLEQRIHLRPEDLECARSKFNDPLNIFLVIRPHDGRASAAFFFWQDGAVNGGLTFPFSSKELGSPSWTSLVGGSPRPSRLHRLLAGARDRVLETGTGMRTALLVVVAVLVALAVAWRIYEPTSATSQPLTTSQSLPPSQSLPTSQSLATSQPAAFSSSQSQALGLRVEKALMGVVIAWNPDMPDVAAAKDANLLIWDGSNPPSFIRLTPAQLHAGRAFFTSVNDRVEVRMDVIGAAGKARTESIISAGRAPDIVSAEQSPRGISTLAPRPLNPPTAAKISAGTAPKPPLEQAKATPRAFTPTAPAARVSGGPVDLPKPPDLESPGGGLTALTQTFHSFNDPQAAPPPKAPEAPVVVREAPRQQPVPETRPPQTQTPASVLPKPVVSSFQAAVPVREMRPQIPTQLKQMVNSDNVVQVLVHIDASGKVTEAKLGAVKGASAGFLSKIAVNAAREWQFRPATQNGQAVASDKILEFLFHPAH